MVGDANSTAPPASGSTDDEPGWWNNPRAQVRRAPLLALLRATETFCCSNCRGKTCLTRPLPPRSQDITFDVLAGCYAIIALVALIQLIRIQRRVPEYG